MLRVPVDTVGCTPGQTSMQAPPALHDSAGGAVNPQLAPAQTTAACGITDHTTVTHEMQQLLVCSYGRSVWSRVACRVYTAVVISVTYVHACMQNSCVFCCLSDCQAMGFSDAQANQLALESTGNDIQAAVAILVSAQALPPPILPTTPEATTAVEEEPPAAGGAATPPQAEAKAEAEVPTAAVQAAAAAAALDTAK